MRIAGSAGSTVSRPTRSRTTGLADAVRREGFTDALLLGMGGSSLGPEILAHGVRPQANFPRLRILDSTVPARIMAIESTLDLGKTLFIVSSKSVAPPPSRISSRITFSSAWRMRSARRRPAGTLSPSPIRAGAGASGHIAAVIVATIVVDTRIGVDLAEVDVPSPMVAAVTAADAGNRTVDHHARWYWTGG